MKEFLKHHEACGRGYKWAVTTCETMQEVWDSASAEDLIWVATRKNVMDDKTARKFACWCVRQIWHLLTDERSRRAVEVSERHVDGLATVDELDAARVAALAASAAAWAAASASASASALAASARAAAWAWASASASASASDAASDAARAAALAASARAAASAAASDAASDAARDAARDAQTKWLRANVVPNFLLEVVV